MQQQLSQPIYYRSSVRRTNYLKELFWGAALVVCSLPRMVCEVFLRRRMGERYGSTMTMVTTGVLLIFFPWLRYTSAFSQATWSFVFLENIIYYAFVAAYFGFAYQRRAELKRAPSVYDFERYTLSTGNLLPFFSRFKDEQGEVNFRLIETCLEPLAVLVAGIVLTVLNGALGALLIACALIYSGSYLAQYYIADNQIMDIIDEKIMAEELRGIIVLGTGPGRARGVRLYGKRPTQFDLRNDLADEMARRSDHSKGSLAL